MYGSFDGIHASVHGGEGSFDGMYGPFDGMCGSFDGVVLLTHSLTQSTPLFCLLVSLFPCRALYMEYRSCKYVYMYIYVYIYIYIFT